MLAVVMTIVMEAGGAGRRGQNKKVGRVLWERLKKTPDA